MMCPPCDKAARKRGKHRAHPCDVSTTSAAHGYVCTCPGHRPAHQGGRP